MEEKKKRTGNVRTTSEVELQELKTRDRKSRNSWANVYSEAIALRKHKNVTGAGGRDRRWGRMAGQVGSTRGGGIFFAYSDMLDCKTKYTHYCIWCSLSYTSWYVVLQKCLICDWATIAARNQRGDDSRIGSVQLEY